MSAKSVRSCQNIDMTTTQQNITSTNYDVEWKSETCLFSHCINEDMRTTQKRLRRLEHNPLQITEEEIKTIELIAVSGQAGAGSLPSSPMSKQKKHKRIIASDGQVQPKDDIYLLKSAQTDTLSLLDIIKHTRQKLQVNTHYLMHMKYINTSITEQMS